MSDFTERAYDYFLGQGYPAHAAAALAGNATHESGGNTRISHDGGTGVGMFGWRDPNPGVGRKTNLINWAQGQGVDPYSEVSQFQFANHELNTSHKDWGDKLRAATDLRGANDATMGFLRPQGYTDSNPAGGLGYAQRFNNAAPLVGAAPMPVPINGPGAGGQGLLAPTPMADPRTANDADMGGYGSPGAAQPAGITAPGAPTGLLGSTDASTMSAGGMASKIGMGVASQQAPRPQWGPLQASMNQPKPIAMPSFGQEIAQQRLRREFGGM